MGSHHVQNLEFLFKGPYSKDDSILWLILGSFSSCCCRKWLQGAVNADVGSLGPTEVNMAASPGKRSGSGLRNEMETGVI